MSQPNESPPITVICPTCDTGMVLKDRSKLGKKASCPNCSNLFVLTETPGDTSAALTDSANPEHEKQSGKTTGDPIAAQQSNSAAGSRSGLIVAGGVGALLLVGVGLWASGILPGGDDLPPDQPVVEVGLPPVAAENKFNLAYLQGDAEIIIKLNLAEAWQTPLLAQVAGLPTVQESLQGLQQNLGLAPADIASLTIGMSGLSEQASAPDQFASIARDRFTAVLRLNGDVDASSLKLMENGCQELQHDGKTYYLFQPAADDSTPDAKKKPLAVFIAEPKLVVIGSEARIQTAMKSGGKQVRRIEIDFVDPHQQLLIVFVPKDKSPLKDLLPPGGGGPDDPAGEMAMIAAQNIRAVGIGIDVDTGIKLQLQANCRDAKTAGEMLQILNGVVAEGRSALSHSDNPMLALFKTPAESVLSSVKTSADSATVVAVATVNEQTIVSLKQLAPFLMLALMGSGGLPGFGNIDPPPTEPASTDATPVDAPVEAPIPSSGTKE